MLVIGSLEAVVVGSHPAQVGGSVPEPARAEADWLGLREPADAAARAESLVADLRPHLPNSGTVTVHDLGCGTGSMARWLAPRLAGPQHWVLHDRDAALLPLVAARPPARAPGGGPVSVETRRHDITRLDPAELAGTSLITASALLDMMTADELERLVALCARAGCPVLITLSVTGHVELTPRDPLDGRIADAFNAHQRRDTGAGVLLGPDAVAVATEGFGRLGLDVTVRPSPWRLGAPERDLTTSWLAGWVGAAVEQDPGLGADAAAYARRRLIEAGSGRLAVTVHHQDLLALPR